ncbi:MAG: MFS transporter [Bilophila wadsworthia]
MPFIPLFQSPKSFYRLAVASFFFLQGLVFASWASRIPDIKQALALNEAQLGGVLFAIPVGQMSAMALSGYLVSRFGSHRMLLLAALLYSGTLMALGFISETWQLFAMLVFFGVAANLHNISVNTQAVGVERLYRRSIMAAFHGLWASPGSSGIVGALFAAFSVSTRVHFSFIFAVCMGIVAIMFRLTLRATGHATRRPDTNAQGKIDLCRPARADRFRLHGEQKDH